MAQLQPPTQRGHPSLGTQGSAAHCPPPQDWCHTHVQDEGAPRHPVDGFVQQCCGERGDVNSHPPPRLGPSPSHESQHCTLQGQGGESRHPESPQVCTEPWASVQGLFHMETAMAGPSHHCPEVSGQEVARETMARLEPRVRAELSAGSCLMPALILGLCPRSFTSSLSTHRVPTGVTSLKNCHMALPTQQFPSGHPLQS